MNPQYLGDGVYASWNGEQIILTTGHHDPANADNVIFLEPDVLRALDAFRKKVGSI